MMTSCNSSPCLKKQEKPPVLKSKATYYNPVTQKWQPGDFMLHRSHLEFVTENSDEETRNPFHLSLPLATISSIEKRKSSFLFAAVVIRVGSEMHWFSSFPNRNAVYYNLDLFWKDNLLGKSFNIKPTTNGLDASQSSSFGRKLLSVLCNSEKHLVSAASALEEQSRLLHDAEDSLGDMNADLSTIEKQLNSLNFVPGMMIPHPLSVEEVPDTEAMTINAPKRRYRVTFSAEKAQNCYDWQRGMLVITDDIALLDERGNTKFYFPNTELRYIKVVSPWELCIVKGCCGETSCHVMCPMLSRVLRVLGMIPSIRDMVVYADDGDMLMNNSSSCSSSVSFGTPPSTPTSPSKAWKLPDLPHIYEQVKKVQGSGYLTDEEIEEISSRLTDLHTLAVEVENEKQAQFERISSLILDAEKADTRVNADTKILRRLAKSGF